MKKTILVILTVLLFVITIVLGNYFNAIVQNEKIAGVSVHVFPMDKTFILPKEVKKMISVKDSLYKKVDIAKLEQQLEKNEYISNAEVFKDLNGYVKAHVIQYHPIARVLGEKSYYVDENGQDKPLSKHYTENVILIYGKLNSKNKKTIINLIKEINSDKDLQAIVSEIHIDTQQIYLKTDQLKAKILININENLDSQLYRLKVIYTYLVAKHKNNQYQKLDLRYANQVVCK